MQIVFYALVLVGALYILACLALFILQRRILYSPKPPMEIPFATIELENNGTKLRGYVINPAQPKALLYYGGNAEQIEQHAEFFSTLADYTTYLFPYRGYGGNPGSPTESSLYSDAEAIYDLVAGDHQSVSLIGRSLGSGVATHVGSHKPIERLVLITPYDSMGNLAQQKYPMFPMRLIVKDKYESWKRIDRIISPMLVFKAGTDAMVPHERTDHLVSRIKPDLVSVITVPDTGHNDIYKSDLYKAAVTKFLAQADAQ